MATGCMADDKCSVRNEGACVTGGMGSDQASEKWHYGDTAKDYAKVKVDDSLLTVKEGDGDWLRNLSEITSGALRSHNGYKMEKEKRKKTRLFGGAILSA
ncbi:hypothetical protein llap_4450 [Limosa lapponica baueri]|uniref:Uncharacterized protein n=1 Tax=Limosa lapponica baueri TaxID=1758121 RepID=A0A2I0UGT0_LIMLA|nr:hypothetical protein llap_4450 [Limosa lapponica baueri]